MLNVMEIGQKVPKAQISPQQETLIKNRADPSSFTPLRMPESYAPQT